MRAFKNRSCPTHCCHNPDLENHLYQEEQFLGITVKKAVIPYPAKSPGQHMTQNQVQEIFTFKGSTAHLLGFAVNIPEGNLAILVSNDIAFADYSPV